MKKNRIKSKRYLPFFESVLDPVRDKLCPDIFDNKKLKPEVKKGIIDIIVKWTKKNIPEAKIKELRLMGSLVTYQYSETSDIDVTVLYDNIGPEVIQDKKKFLPNGNFLINTKHPLNFFIVISKRDVWFKNAVYNIGTDVWETKPEVEGVKIPYTYTLEIAKLFMTGVDSRIQEYEDDTREKAYYERLLKDGGQTETEIQEIQNKIKFKSTEIYADLDALHIAFGLIKAFRSEAFDDTYKTSYLIQIKSSKPDFSINNIVYKIIENYGYLEKLHDYNIIRKTIRQEELNIDSEFNEKI